MDADEGKVLKPARASWIATYALTVLTLMSETKSSREALKVSVLGVKWAAAAEYDGQDMGVIGRNVWGVRLTVVDDYAWLAPGLAQVCEERADGFGLGKIAFEE